jgi:hypothetical protein
MAEQSHHWDKSWVFSKTLMQSDRACNGNLKDLPYPKKEWISKLKVKTVLISFFECKGIVQ